MTNYTATIKTPTNNELVFTTYAKNVDEVETTLRNINLSHIKGECEFSIAKTECKEMIIKSFKK
jgi:hypothetical protein